MSYQTLLAHLPFEEDAEAVLGIAASLAERHSAHLLGLHVLPRLDLPYSYEVPLALAQEFAVRHRERAARLGERFETLTRNGDFVAEWCLIDDMELPTEQVLIELGNTADLVILAQTSERARRGARGELGARLLAAGARPVLLVPPERDAAATVGERVFVAWDGQRAATRALFGALPLLARAETVRLQRVNAPSRDRRPAIGATEELADTLSRHGVAVEVFHADAREAEIGAELVGFASDWGADLVVAGCQERAVLRELLFGSTTRYLLEHVKVPVLMST